MSRIAARWPLLFSCVLLLILFGFTAVSRAAFPRDPVGDIRGLSTEQLAEPTALDQVSGALKNPETLFWSLTILLSVVLLLALRWWREAGLGAPRWRNVHLVLFPLIAVALSLSGGVYLASFASFASIALVVLVAVVGEELFFRGLLWRALVPRGPLWAVLVTALLGGALALGRLATDGPFPEALRIAAATSCGAVLYGALRWRTASLWPPLAVHLAVELSADLGNISSTVYPILLYFTTLGFLLYGLFLLRNRRARADGA